MKRPAGMANFQRRTVSFREGILKQLFRLLKKTWDGPVEARATPEIQVHPPMRQKQNSNRIQKGHISTVSGLKVIETQFEIKRLKTYPTILKIITAL